MALMSKQEYRQSLQEDPINEKGGRSRRNTPTSAYNCGGFALSIYDWITPYILTDDCKDVPEGEYTDEERTALMLALNDAGWAEEYIEDEVVDRDVQFLLTKYPFLEEVNLEDCDPDETVIAYRIFITWDHEIEDVEDTDFHFKVRYHNFWFEKLGSESVTVCNLDADKPWVYPKSEAAYTSKIVYFTTRRKYI